MSTYKVIIRNSPGWREFGACTLGVSVGSPNWQDQRFASILAFAAEHFKKIRIDVTDLLYWHNFAAEGMPPEEAAAQASRLGGAWLLAHQHIIDACAIKPEIIRWAKWYEHPDYRTTLAGFRRAECANPILHDAVDADIDEFFRRQGRVPSAVERRHSRDYLIEELAVITLQARELASLKLYPGDELSCMNVVRRGLVSEAPTGLDREQFAKVKFHARGIPGAAEVFSRPAPDPVGKFVPSPALHTANL